MVASTKRIEKAAVKWLVRLESNNVDATLEKQFLTWLEASPAHQAAYIQAEHTWQRAAVLKKSPISQMDTHQSIHREKRQRPQAPFRWAAWGGALACTAVLVVYLAIGQPFSPTLLYQQDFYTAAGEQGEWRLPDDTRVYLNAQSHIHVVYTKQSRRVELAQGEAFFDVARNPKKPFDVQTGSGFVRVLGTQFSVSLKDEKSVVTVLEGRVGLIPNTAVEGDTPVQTLTQGEQLSMEDAAVKPPKKVDAESFVAWRKGHLVFRGESIADVIQTLREYFGKDIRLAPSVPQDNKVIAVLQLTTVEETLKAFGRALDLDVKFMDDGILLVPSVE